MLQEDALLMCDVPKELLNKEPSEIIPSILIVRLSLSLFSLYLSPSLLSARC